MRNKLIILTIYFIFFHSINFVYAFKFETESIQIFKETNKIVANNGKALSFDNDLEIYANRFEYFKDINFLNSKGNGEAKIKSKNLIIKFDEADFDQKKMTFTAKGGVKINQTNKNFTIETDEIFYDKLNNLIISDTKTILKDNFQNIYFVESFKFEIEKNLLKVINLKLQDKNMNIVRSKVAFINTKSGKLFGKDINVNFDSSSFEKQNEPRLKANSMIIDENLTNVTKGVFTTCKKRDNCPPWEMRSEKIQHDKNKKTINYKNAFLRIYDIPVMYFPKFFHPDPTVKRQSGFLIPTIKNSNDSKNYLNTPYFLAIAENKDATFSPRFYTKDRLLVQTEYRQVNAKSNQIADFSYSTKKNESSKNHFFYEFQKDLDFDYFENNEINLKVQQTSNDTYLKADKLSGKIIDNYDILENTFNLSLYSNDLSINFDTTVYEDLGKKDSSDKYEYILPKLSLIKKINTKNSYNGNFTFKSQATIRNYNTNIYERNNLNELIFKSYPKISFNGFYNNYEFIIKNSNTSNENSTYKNNENLYLSGIFQYNSVLPLIKENEAYQKILKPQFSLKLAPPHTKDNRNEESKIDFNNIFTLERLSENTTEGGLSLAYGSEYSILNKEKSNEIFNLRLANNLRLENNDDISNSHQMGEKTSNFFSEIEFNPNEYLKTKYSNSLKNDLKNISYENLTTEFRINNFVTKFDYLNENSSSKNSYLTNETTLNLDENNSLSFSTRENKEKNLTEYYNFMYQYKNDCLAASIEYNKDYYSDRELKPEESIFFKLTIMPFGEAMSPNLRK